MQSGGITFERPDATPKFEWAIKKHKMRPPDGVAVNALLRRGGVEPARDHPELVKQREGVLKQNGRPVWWGARGMQLHGRWHAQVCLQTSPRVASMSIASLYCAA